MNHSPGPWRAMTSQTRAYEFRLSLKVEGMMSLVPPGKETLAEHNLYRAALQAGRQAMMKGPELSRQYRGQFFAGGEDQEGGARVRFVLTAILDTANRTLSVEEKGERYF